jgi:hypothetical protein
MSWELAENLNCTLNTSDAPCKAKQAKIISLLIWIPYPISECSFPSTLTSDPKKAIHFLLL